MSNTIDASPMMRAVRLQHSDRIPVWLMRQAGRYMQEYRNVRNKVTFIELCKTPSLAAEVMLTAVERLGVDAAIIFSDILLILEPMGFGITFPDEGGPRVTKPIRNPQDVKNIKELESENQLHYVMDTVRYTREGLNNRMPLIGFAGAPFTLATYTIGETDNINSNQNSNQNRKSTNNRNFQNVKAFMHLYQTEWSDLMHKFAVSTAKYLNGQIAAGAEIIQIFDSWAGCLSVEDYAEFVQPYSKLLIDLILPGTPVIHFAPGNPMLLPNIAASGGNVIGVDWRIPIDKAWDIIGNNHAIQGNLDPAILLTDRDTIRRNVQKIIRLTKQKNGFIFNLGHGILPQTPTENAIALVEAVHEFGQK
ncbi:MAG: uroporphyrinogen decarboxylase [Planctomycetaceae bacterium]|jgi:uroporphyrinogen decarboxylase|nr:uroporphyrinogen decarboxylase [Planctomycetaceae bacterium]